MRLMLPDEIRATDRVVLRLKSKRGTALFGTAARYDLYDEEIHGARPVGNLLLRFTDTEVMLHRVVFPEASGMGVATEATRAIVSALRRTSHPPSIIIFQTDLCLPARIQKVADDLGFVLTDRDPHTTSFGDIGPGAVAVWEYRP